MRLCKTICKECCRHTEVVTGTTSCDISDPIPWSSQDDKNWEMGLIHCPNMFQSYSWSQSGIPGRCLYATSQRKCIEGNLLPVVDERAMEEAI